MIAQILALANRPEVISFAGGLPSPEGFPVKAIQEAADRTLENEALTALQYTVSQCENLGNHGGGFRFPDEAVGRRHAFLAMRVFCHNEIPRESMFRERKSFVEVLISSYFITKEEVHPDTFREGVLSLYGAKPE